MSARDNAHPEPADGPIVSVDDESVRIDGLVVRDPSVRDLVVDLAPTERADAVARALAVGARGLLTMGIGADLQQIDERVRAAVAGAADEAEHRLEAVLQQAQHAMADQLDPNRRNSLIASSLRDFGEWRDGFLSAIDPADGASPTHRLLQDLTALLGPGGVMENRLTQLLDPSLDDSALGQLERSISRQLTELRDIVMREDGARREAVRGTAKGVEFEDDLEDTLRGLLTHAPGTWVERTSDESGSGGKVGDFVIITESGRRIVIEAKNTSTAIRLGGTSGILAELERAAANRNADFAICVSREAVFPAENGAFGVYGNRVCVVDDGSGVMVHAALTWARTALALTEARSSGADVRVVEERLQGLRSLAQQISNAQRSLTSVTNSVATLKSTLDTMRSDLLAHVDDISREIHRTSDRRAELRAVTEAG